MSLRRWKILFTVCSTLWHSEYNYYQEQHGEKNEKRNPKRASDNNSAGSKLLCSSVNRSCGEIVECLDLLVDKITYYFGLRSPAPVALQWLKELISVVVQRRVRASRNIKISLQSNGLLLKRSVRFMVYSRLLCSIFRMLWARTTKRNGEIVISSESLRRRFHPSRARLKIFLRLFLGLPAVRLGNGRNLFG